MSPEEHAAGLIRINELMDAEEGTPEAKELSELAERVADYEKKRFPLDLKIIGEIKPPESKCPVQMLRDIADDIEAGDLGSVLTVVVAIKAKQGHRVFGAGVLSSLEHVALLFSAAAAQLSAWVWTPYEETTR